jgi:hypothetical protein
MTELICESRILSMPAGDILEIKFRGIHVWTHGSDMLQFAESKIRESVAAAVLFNLNEYNYVAGNDIVVTLIAATRAPRRALSARPVCIVASGPTHRAVQNLIEAGRLGTLGIELASELDQALENLQHRMK